MTDTSLSPQVTKSLRNLASRCGETLMRLHQAEQLSEIEGLLLLFGVGGIDDKQTESFRRELVNMTRRQLGLEGAVLYLYDPESHRYVPREARGLKNIERPIEYAPEGYAVGETFVGLVAEKRELRVMECPSENEVKSDRCLTLLCRQTHSRRLTLCVGVPLESALRRPNEPPFGVLVLVDGRSGAELRPELQEWRGGPVSALAAQITADIRLKEILEGRSIFWTAMHQAKNPLSKIAQFVSAIRRWGPKDDYLDGLEASTQEAIQGVERILRGQAILHRREPPPEPVRFDLSDLVQRTADGFRASAQLSNQRIDCAVEAPCVVVGVQEHAKAVLDNLLDNAIKYGVLGSGRVEIRLGATPAGWTLAVCDNGPGIPDDVLKSIRDPRTTLLRVKAGQDIASGFGLGLFIVSSYAEKLGWHMEVKRRTEGGTEFIFDIPEVSSGLILETDE